MANLLKNFLNNQFVDAAFASGSVDLVSPVDGSVLNKVPLSTRRDLDIAVSNAKTAFVVWSNLTVKQRAAIMFKLHHLIDQHSDELAKLIMKENGKNMTEALADLAKGNETVEWACSLPQLLPGKILNVSGGITCEEWRSPLGVVAAIVPFNFPAMVPLWTIPISLTVGNCVILKPSEKVPLTMMRIAELMIEAGMPPGVFQIVNGAVDVVNSMCEHPDIAALTFVGSSKVAQIVSSKCHAMNKRVLALGGAKNHLIALSDCDVGMASRDIVASFAGCCGQRCMAASALIVVDQTDDNSDNAVINEVVAVAAKLNPGQGAGEVGPLIDNIAKERVLKYINEAEKGGAKVLLDGRPLAASGRPGFWVGPTIILHSSKDDPALKEEIFGPVLSIIKVKTYDEAIAIENDNPYGNAACVYTEKGANADYFTKRFRAAMLGVNIGIPVPREPFSFGGLYGTLSKFGDFDITGDGALEFFTNRIKITKKWSASYGTSSNNVALGGGDTKRMKVESTIVDKANFDGKM
jgi:methylmalonic acid semialdehyde dehydrogenase